MTTLVVQALAGRSLRQMTVQLGPGMHVALALDPTGTDELIPLLDGSAAPSRGKVTLEGRDPYRSPEVRRHIGSLWQTEFFPQAPTVRESIEKLPLDSGLFASLESLLGAWGLGECLAQPWHALGPFELRSIALGIALSKPELWALLLSDPLAGHTREARSAIVERLMQQAVHIPVLVLTRSRSTAMHLGGPCAEVSGGFWRRVQPNRSAQFVLRVAGTSLRPLAAEIVRRPRVRTLQLTNHTEGHDELWVHTEDPRSVSLDVVRITRQLGLRIWSIDTTTGTP